MADELTIACLDGRPCHVHDTARVIAAAEARGRAAERERCAGMVREVASKFLQLSTASLVAGKDRHCTRPAYEEGKKVAFDLAEAVTRDLAERIGKGE